MKPLGNEPKALGCRAFAFPKIPTNHHFEMKRGVCGHPLPPASLPTATVFSKSPINVSQKPQALVPPVVGLWTPKLCPGANVQGSTCDLMVSVGSLQMMQFVKMRSQKQCPTASDQCPQRRKWTEGEGRRDRGQGMGLQAEEHQGCQLCQEGEGMGPPTRGAPEELTLSQCAARGPPSPGHL